MSPYANEFEKPGPARPPALDDVRREPLIESGLVRFALLLVLVSAVLVFATGGMRRSNPLDNATVIHWTPGECGEGELWAGEYRQADSDQWFPAVFGGEVMDPGECLAFPPIWAVVFRACCVDADDETNRNCLEAEPGEKISTPCSQIYNLHGSPYRSDHVLRWNAAHVAEPTPEPSPKVDETGNFSPVFVQPVPNPRESRGLSGRSSIPGNPRGLGTGRPAPEFPRGLSQGRPAVEILLRLEPDRQIRRNPPGLAAVGQIPGKSVRLSWTGLISGKPSDLELEALVAEIPPRLPADPQIRENPHRLELAGQIPEIRPGLEPELLIWGIPPLLRRAPQIRGNPDRLRGRGQIPRIPSGLGLPGYIRTSPGRLSLWS
jgi:hypothetical protein